MAKKKIADYDGLAKSIVSKVGGKENIRSVRHCITRVRFQLADESRANDQALKDMQGVMGVVKGGGEYMVVIGNEVGDVYDAIVAQLGADNVQNVPAESDAKKKNPVMFVLNMIMGAIMPALDLICAGGILKGILTLLNFFGIVDSASGFSVLLNAMGDAIFYFLPIVLGYNFAKKLGNEPFLGLFIGAILCYPAVNGTDISLFGFTTNATYTSSFLPVIGITAVAVPLAKFLKRYIPKVVAGFLVPVITLLIVIPLGFLLIGPTVTWAGNAVNDGVNFLLNVAPVLGGVLFGGLYPVMVVFGIHGAVGSFSFMNVLSGHPEAIMCMCCVQCFATSGVLLAVYLKSKDERLKEISLPAFISSLFGITEPAIYGVLLPNMRLLVCACIGSAVSGAAIMLTGTLMYTYTGLGVFTFLGLVDPAAPNYLIPIFTAVIGFAVAFALTFLSYRTAVAEQRESKPVLPDEPAQPATFDGTYVMASPISGEVKELSECPDEVFSAGILGQGVVIEPTEGKVYAPCDGEIASLFDTLHAIGIQADCGAELLIHVGMNTVSLNGEGFKAHIKTGDRIQKGQLLLEFDMDFIRSKNLPVSTPVVITEADKYPNMEKHLGVVSHGDALLTLE